MYANLVQQFSVVDMRACEVANSGTVAETSSLRHCEDTEMCEIILILMYRCLGASCPVYVCGLATTLRLSDNCEFDHDSHGITEQHIELSSLGLGVGCYEARWLAHSLRRKRNFGLLLYLCATGQDDKAEDS
jgi:hypothetical protein